MTPRRGRKLAVAALVVVAVAVSAAGCSKHSPVPSPGPSTLAVGTSLQTLDVGGVQRTFRVYRPATLKPGPVPLVLMLHGGFGSGSQAEASYGWDAEADRGRFLVAYPDGLNRAWAVGGGCCGRPGSAGVDDVGFITALVGTISSEVAIDHARVFATGISNGGMLTYRLACDTNLFAAIGPDSATMLGACPAPARVSVIHVHGTADHNIRYDGGPGDGVATIDGPPVPVVVEGWRTVDGCGTAVAVVRGPVTTSTARCPSGRAVVLVTIAGAGHQWPGATPKPAAQHLLGLDPPSTALDATETIWQFFAAHPKPAT